MLIVEMLSTGDEVLHGQIIDTNAAWLADCFFQHGLPLNSRTTVGDSLTSLVQTLLERSHCADILIVNGGLGPTSDDLSALAAATAAEEPLIEHAEWIAVMEDYFASRGRIMPDTNRKQAQLPASAQLIDNPVGTACGFSIVINDCLMFFTPGVPSEFKVMIKQEVIPRLQLIYGELTPPLCLRLTSFGRSESSLAKQFDYLPLPEDCVIGYRSSTPIIELKLTGPADKKQEMLKNWQIIKQGVGENMIFEGTEGLPVIISRLLTERALSIALSEQFTAGLLHWQLSSAGVKLNEGKVVAEKSAQTLTELVAHAQELAAEQLTDIVLAIGHFEQNQFALVLYTPTSCYAQKIKYMPTNHNVKDQQDACVILALDMLLRWLNDRPVFGHYEWLTQIEKLEL